MKIQFLGTSFGAPTKERHQQSVLIETNNGNAYIFDAGAPVLDLLVRNGYDLTKIKAVFISHLHGDHLNGLFDLINLSEYFGMQFKVYMPEQSGIELIETYIKAVNSTLKSDCKLISLGEFYNADDFSVSSYVTDHLELSNGKSYGFMCRADGANVYITGDMHPSLKDFPSVLVNEKTDLIVTECAHFTADALCDRLNKCNTKRVAFIHVMPVGKYDDLLSLKNRFNFVSIFPNDNDEIII